MVIHSATFTTSSSKIEQCPNPNLPEYAFIGRSNVGKSSLINMLTGIKALAKVSGTPGKTQLINHFVINENWYLVDLPGYGYAKTSRSNRTSFSEMIKRYVTNRENLHCLFVLIDSRLDPQTIDLEFVNWAGSCQVPLCLVFTKTDKISSNALSSTMAKFSKEMLKTWEVLPKMLTCSSVTRTGRTEILNFIDEINRTGDTLE